METTDDGARARRLRAVGEPEIAGRDAMSDAIEACVAADPAGIAVRDLRRVVGERLALAPDAVIADDLTAALGLLIATGRVDESGGRLLALSQERRRAG